MRNGAGIRTALVLQFAQDALHLTIVRVAGISLHDIFGTLLYLLQVALRVIDLNDIVRHNIAVLHRMFDSKKLRQGLVVVAQFVQGKRIVVT